MSAGELRWYFKWLLIVASLVAGIPLVVESQELATRRRIDPAARGSDHVGKPIAAYMTGDECFLSPDNQLPMAEFSPPVDHVPETDHGQLREALLRPARFQTHNRTCDY